VSSRPSLADEPPSSTGSPTPAAETAGPGRWWEVPSDTLDGLYIRSVDVQVWNVYEPLPEGRLRPLYRLANRLHVRTKPRFVRDQLLFAKGGRWSALRGQESERLLRALNFLTPLPIVATRTGDSLDVTVVTRDRWSTSTEFDLESFEGSAFGSVAFSERNLLGYGKNVSFVYREVPTGISRSISYDDPAVLGSRLHLRYGASKGSLGATDQFAVGVPFYALGTRSAFSVSGIRQTSVANLFDNGVSLAEFDRELKQAEVWWGNGWFNGRTVHRLTWSYLTRDRELGPSRLQPGAPLDFAGDREQLRLRRIAVEGQIWRPHYIERRNVDRMTLIEDFEIGTSLALKFGMSPESLGSSEGEAYGEMRFDIGTEAPFGFGWVRTELSSRVRGRPVDTVERVEARWVGQSDPRRALVLSALGIRGSRTVRDFQVVVGGLNGLRAYPVEALAGKRMWRLNAEQRWTVSENLWQIVTVGGVVFTDAARAWGAGAEDTHWFVSAGGGLRLSLPQWSLGSLLRIDVAFPLDPTRGGRRRPVLSIGSSQGF